MKKITSQKSYIFALMLSLLIFWLGGRQDAMLYSIAFFYLIIPASTLISSAAWSMNHSFGSSVILALCHGLSFMMVEYCNNKPVSRCTSVVVHSATDYRTSVLS